MAKQAGMGAAFYVNGNDIGGDTQSFVIHGGPATTDMTDITQSAMARQGALRSSEVSWVSFFDAAAGASHAVLSPQLNTDVIATALMPPVAIGCPAVAQTGKQLNYDGTRTNTADFTLAVNEQSNGFSQEWGNALTAGKRTDTTATNGTSYDFGGASPSFGWQAYLQVFAFSGTDVSIKIQDSADNASFLLITGGTFASVTTAPQAQRLAGSSSAQVREYVRVATSTTGGFTSVTFAVMIAVNQTAVAF